MVQATKRKQLHDWDLASGIRSTIANGYAAKRVLPYEMNPLRDEKGRPND